MKYNKHILKIYIRLEEESDIDFWLDEKQQQWLLNDLYHKFDLDDSKIIIMMEEDWG